jgi:hypothetical protein
VIEVELGELKKLGKDFAELLEQRLKTEVAVKGATLVLSDPANGHLSMKDAKLQVKHALHHLNLSDDYRVHSEHHVIHLMRVEEKKTHYVEKGRAAPPPAKSLPYFFPG